MITADPIAVFPECPTFGMTGGPRYDVRVIPREGGRERRNARWRYALHRYTSEPLGNREEEVIQAVLDFYHAMGGRELNFRYKDYRDYKSCRTHASVTPTDAPLEANDDSPVGYQLLKRYGSGAYTRDRLITRPVGSTIRIANHLGVEQAASRWTLDEATGVLTPGVSFVGTPATWGGEFDVYCRFDCDLDIELTERAISNVTLAISEDRDE